MLTKQGEWLRQGLTFDIGEYIVGEAIWYVIQYHYQLSLSINRIKNQFSSKFRLHLTWSTSFLWRTSLYDICIRTAWNRNRSTSTGWSGQIRSNRLDGIIWWRGCYTWSSRIDWFQIGILSASRHQNAPCLFFFFRCFWSWAIFNANQRKIYGLKKV